MLQNVQTRWMSLIEPLWRFLSEYQTLLYKMTADLNENNKAKVRFNFVTFVFFFVALIGFRFSQSTCKFFNFLLD